MIRGLGWGQNLMSASRMLTDMGAGFLSRQFGEPVGAAIGRGLAAGNQAGRSEEQRRRAQRSRNYFAERAGKSKDPKEDPSDAQSRVFKKVYGMEIADLEGKWRKWVLSTYPRK